jgi:hypothetical protein
LRNIFEAGLPWEAAKPGSKRLMLRPVLRTDFIKANGLVMQMKLEDKAEREKALSAELFEVMAIAADVELPNQVEVGDFVVIGIASAESPDKRGKRISCHEMDVAVIFKKSDMQA